MHTTQRGTLALAQQRKRAVLSIEVKVLLFAGSLHRVDHHKRLSSEHISIFEWVSQKSKPEQQVFKERQSSIGRCTAVVFDDFCYPSIFRPENLERV